MIKILEKDGFVNKTFIREFNSVKEAKEYLKQKVRGYYEFSNCNKNELESLLNTIEKYGVLCLDNVIYQIEYE